MNKLIKLIAIFAIMSSSVFAAGGHIEVGYKSKLIEQGVVTDENAVHAGAGVEFGGFGLGVDTFSKIDASGTGKDVSSSGLFKRIDVTASYNFTSPLANLTLGGIYRNASKTVSVAGLSNNVYPFVKLHGNAFKLFPWDVTVLNDTRNRTNNFEGNFRLPMGPKSFKLVPAVGIGFNDPGAATVAALKGAKKYYNFGLGVSLFNGKAGSVTADFYAHRKSLTESAGQITGFNAGYLIKF